MQLICPSCSATYESTEYPNSFEINCVCGYSILVPHQESQSQSVSSKIQSPNFDAAVPSAMEAEDDGLLIRPEGLVALNPDQKENFLGGAGVLGMTPPENLPIGMVYDPFELPNVSIDHEGTDEESLDLGNEDVFSSDDVSSPPSGKPAPVAMAAPKAPSSPSKAQNLVSRSQLASMGNFIGASFSLKIQDVSDDDMARIVIRIQKILNDRPWLQSEVKKRNLQFEKLQSEHALDQVPEILALEIYLAAFELGGQCSFTLSL